MFRSLAFFAISRNASSENCKSTTEYDNSESSKTSLDSEIEDSGKVEEIDFNVKDVHYKSNVESNKSYFTEVSYGGGTVLSSTPINKNPEEWPGLSKDNLNIELYLKHAKDLHASINYELSPEGFVDLVKVCLPAYAIKLTDK